MVYELSDTSKAAVLFGDWPETLVTSCLQKVMGKVYVTDLEQPKSALAYVGCFAFYAGEPDRELVVHNLAGFVIMTPQNEAWANLKPQTLLDMTGLHVGEPFLICGGPPCQPFSTAGKRLGINDPRGSLFMEFIRMIDFIKPRFFIMHMEL